MTFAGILLLLPLIAMQFTNEVNWSPFDFIVGAVLLFGTGALIELVLRQTKKYRFVLVITVLLVFFMIWVELAVGIFGTPFAGD